MLGNALTSYSTPAATHPHMLLLPPRSRAPSAPCACSITLDLLSPVHTHNRMCKEVRFPGALNGASTRGLQGREHGEQGGWRL